MPTSHTGKALREYELALTQRPQPRASVRAEALPLRKHDRLAPHRIRIHNAREHNLKNIDVDIPRDKFTVITGVSGSGKTTLAFDILFAEGQRRYLESLNAYARQFVQPAVAPGRGRDLRHPAHGRDRAAHQPRRPQEHGRHAHRDLSLPAPAVREARHAVLPRLRRADRAAELRGHRGAHPARLPRTAHRPARAAGRRTARATTPTSPSGRRARATRTCASTASSCRRRMAAPRPLPASTPSSCRSPTCASRRTTKPTLREALARALDFGKGVVHVLGAARGARARDSEGATRRTARMPQTVFSTKRACPSCGTQLPRARPAAVLVQLASTAGARPASAPA